MSRKATAEKPNFAVLEYLEAFAVNGLNREIAQEEATWRALPLFLTALGLLAAAIRGLLLPVSGLGVSIFSVACYAVAITAIIFIVMSVIYIERILRLKRHRYPPNEEALCKWAEDRRAYYLKQGMVAESVEYCVLGDLRRHVLTELAASATNNRVINIKKQRDKGLAVRWLLYAGVATLVLGLVCLAYDVSVKTNLRILDERKRPAAAAASTAPTAATTPTRIGVGRESPRNPAENQVTAEAKNERLATTAAENTPPEGEVKR